MATINIVKMLGLILGTGIRLATPITLAALGEAYAESSGVMNIGMEGVMELSALSAFAAALLTNSIGVGLITSIVVGGLLGAIVAFLTITLRLNQIFTGITLWIFGLGMSAFLYQSFIRSLGGELPRLKATVTSIKIPYLSEIPILGHMLFDHDLMVYFTIILTVILWIILFKTPLGLQIRAIGERPQVADTLGVNVIFTRYLCVIISGILGGLGGAYITLVMLGMYYNRVWTGIVAGRVWIGIIVTNFGNWNPWQIFLGALMIGSVDALQYRLQTMIRGVPTYAFLMLPYLLSTCLIFVARKKYPESLGKPYIREE